jgi:hypothetical protein
MAEFLRSLPGPTFGAVKELPTVKGWVRDGNNKGRVYRTTDLVRQTLRGERKEEENLISKQGLSSLLAFSHSVLSMEDLSETTQLHTVFPPGDHRASRQ